MDRTPPPPRNALEMFLRRHSMASYIVLVLGLYLLAACALALALAPALALADLLFAAAPGLPGPTPWLLRGLALALGWFVFGMTLLGVTAGFNRILPTRFAPYRGSYYALETLPWFLHNGLFYLVRFTFLPFVTLTPFGTWFLRAFGMKIGRKAFINTEYISDPAFITIGDGAVIGGSVRIFAHHGGGDRLVIAPVTVGHRAILGLACSVMGDVMIGDDAVILPASVLLPGSRVPPGAIWGGVPARPIPREEMDALKRLIRGDS